MPRLEAGKGWREGVEDGSETPAAASNERDALKGQFNRSRF
jgi:hypothetical protein